MPMKPSKSSASRSSVKSASKSSSGARRKNFLLPQAKIDRARKILGTATDTETIVRALDAVVDLAAFRDETDAALAQFVGQGNIINYFDPPEVVGVRERAAS